MKRVGVLLMVALALVAIAAADVAAQPKVTITGLVDNVTSYTKNLSIVDQTTHSSGDEEWYARTRVRPDITAEVGTTKFVLGLEIDAVWGQTGATDNTAPNRFGATHSWDLNTDVTGVIEVKWAYTEFMIPGLGATTFRIGAQPWNAQYKLAALANGDFAGVDISTTWSPMVKTHFTWAAIEEESTGLRDGFMRGEDFAIIASVEVTPFKGLDLRPLVSWAQFTGPTSTSARANRAGVAGSGAAIPFTGSPFAVCSGSVASVSCPAAAVGSSSMENRYTLGIDARWRFGAFYVDPTFFYQFGNREIVLTAPTLLHQAGTHNQDIKAWLLDIRGGWQAGPLLLEGAFIYTTGNEKEDRVDLGYEDVKFFQPISTDSGFYATWAELTALGIDYFNAVHNGTSLFTGTSIGYDKYGLIRVGARASYALTPAFTFRGAVTTSWTQQDVASSTERISGALGRAPCSASLFLTEATCAAAVSAENGDNYLGTELNIGFQWRFAPNVAFDVVGSYMWAGDAWAARDALSNNSVTRPATDPKDVSALTARIRYTW